MGSFEPTTILAALDTRLFGFTRAKRRGLMVLFTAYDLDIGSCRQAIARAWYEDELANQSIFVHRT
jgi:hypothetical protein